MLGSWLASIKRIGSAALDKVQQWIKAKTKPAVDRAQTQRQAAEADAPRPLADGAAVEQTAPLEASPAHHPSRDPLALASRAVPLSVAT